MRVAFLVFSLAMAARPLAGQYALTLDRPDGGPAVVPAVDPLAPIPATFRARDPYAYDCVATIALRDADGVLIVAQLEAVGAALRDRVWVYPERLYDKRAHPRRVAVVGHGDAMRLIVAWRPDNSRLRHVVALRLSPDSASGLVETSPFEIPVEALVLCGRMPDVNLAVMMPDGSAEGMNLDMGFSIRVPWTRSCVQTLDSAGAATTPVRTQEYCFLRGLLELRGEGTMTTASSSQLLDYVGVSGRVSFKPLGGWGQWITLGALARVESTERLNIFNVAYGATLDARLDMVRPENVQTFWRRFTPYPMLSVEYAKIVNVKGATEFESAGWNGSAQRLRVGLDWTVPMLVKTTLGIKARTDYFLSGTPVGDDPVKALLDLTLRYALSSSGEVGVIGRFLAGSAPPLYQSTSRLLAGIDFFL